MTSDAHPASSSTSETVAPKPADHRHFSAVFFAILALGTGVILCNGRALTPDFVDRANADGPNLVIMLVAFATIFGLLGLAAVTMSRQWILTGLVTSIGGWFTMMWVIASIFPSDYDGEYNAYTRRLDPLPSQYEDLAAAKSLPAVAAQIRTAAADGRIDRGEAHDILNGETYFAASAEASERERAAVRRKVLAP